VRQVQIRDPRPRERRPGVEPVLDELNGTVGEGLGIQRAGHPDDALDVGRELGLRPDDAVDAELPEPLPVVEFEELLARHKAVRARHATLAGNRARNDVDLIEPGARDEHVGALDAGLHQHVGAGGAAMDELHVERLKAARHLRRVIDDEHLVLERQRLRQGEADLASADDRHAHACTPPSNMGWTRNARAAVPARDLRLRRRQP
jgi:hypothetical protein